MATLEERTAKVEGILEEMRNRLGTVESRLGSLERKVDTHFLWLLGVLLGVLIPMWVSIILTVVFTG